MFSYKANAICMADMTMPAWAGVAASHCWNRVRKPGQLINYVRFWPHRWTFAKKRTAHAQTHYRKSTQWQWASFVSAVCKISISTWWVRNICYLYCVLFLFWAIVLKIVKLQVISSCSEQNIFILVDKMLQPRNLNFLGFNIFQYVCQDWLTQIVHKLTQY